MRNPFVPVAAAVLVLPLSIQAITFNITYDSSVTTLTNAAQVETAFGIAAQAFQSQWTNVATINITVYWGATGPFSGGISLGESQTSFVGNPTYAQLTNALRAARASAADSNSVASLPATDPTGGAPWWIPTAEAKVLTGLGSSSVATNDPGDDGDVGFADNVTYTFNPTNRAVPGEFDFIGVAEHEISEVLGRSSGLGLLGSGYVPYDLFRFTSSGVRSLNVNDTSVYFSVDNGVTVLKYFNPNNGDDVQDWASSATPDSYDAVAVDGNADFLSPIDVTALDVLGFNTPGIAASRLSAKRLTGGNMQLTFTNLPSIRFTILASTNVTSSITNWTALGTATEISAGSYQFIDTQTAANKQRYYRMRSP